MSARLRMMKDGGGDGKGQRDLITRDLLGGCDLGGQDRRLDLMVLYRYFFEFLSQFPSNFVLI